MPARTSRVPAAGGAAAAAALVIALVACVHAVIPLKPGLALVIVFLWAALPGVIIARRLYGTWAPSLLTGPVWGFAASSAVLLALWIAGVRSMRVLALSPAIAMAAAVPCGRLAGLFCLPRFDRRDLVPVLFVLAMVPLVDGLPYAHVGQTVPEGRAYRAYFTADFVWAMAEAGEVAKGDVPPRNSFMAGDQMHYYWLANLLSSVEHRATQRTLRVEQVLLTNAVLLDLAFMAFFYFFTRHFVSSAPAAAIACVAAVLFSSFEGIQQLYVLWIRGAPLDLVRTLNIDAVTRWFFATMPVDGLQRLLLYQPHHATAWALGLSALLVLVQSRQPGHAGVTALAGVFLSISLLLSSFIAVLIAGVVGIYQLGKIAIARRWTSIVTGGAAAAIPIGIALLVSRAMHYVDTSGGSVVSVGLNGAASHNFWTGLVLSFGPMVIGAAAGAVLGLLRRDKAMFIPALIIAVAFWFFFFVDVIDHQHVYVGWRAGHLLFIAFTPLVGYALQELWKGSRRQRMLTAAIAGVLALAAAPMTAIDLYNAQDTSNRMLGPGFRWTVIITNDELEAFQWLKQYTPVDATVQIEPTARDSETWAYMPAFGERRMAAGIPISMIPLQKYRDASERVHQVFLQQDAAQASALARSLGIDYLFLGPVEKERYPQFDALLASAPVRFTLAFRNASVTIYRVARDGA